MQDSTTIYLRVRTCRIFHFLERTKSIVVGPEHLDTLTSVNSPGLYL